MGQDEGTFLARQLQSTVQPLLAHVMQQHPTEPLPLLVDLRIDQLTLIRLTQHHLVPLHLQDAYRDLNAVFLQERNQKIGAH